jgi:hypothetical protein
MTTTQCEDPNERVAHPRWYNSHSSGIECIELIENLPANFANAVKYIWRCGLKTTETPLRDLKSARWYTRREEDRIELYELYDEPTPKTAVVWRALAKRVVEIEETTTLGEFLCNLLANDFDGMLYTLDSAIQELESPQEETPP